MKREIKQKLKDIKHQLRNVYWWMYGNTLSNPRLPNDPRSLLFICKGNICRSPFAERLAVGIAKNKGYVFNSAGLEVFQPLTPPENAILAAASFGVKLSDHKSRKINQEMIDSADMVLVMEPWHIISLKKTFPYVEDKRKIFLLPLLSKTDQTIKENFHRYNIFDPYGQPADQFERCFEKIQNSLLVLFTRLSP